MLTGVFAKYMHHALHMAFVHLQAASIAPDGDPCICNNDAGMLSICNYYKYFYFGINNGHQGMQSMDRLGQDTYIHMYVYAIAVLAT